MVSPYGIRGAICERFGWTLKYLEHEIPWLKVHFMMIDAPQFLPPKKKGVTDGPAETKKDKSNADKLSDVLNKFRQ